VRAESMRRLDVNRVVVVVRGVGLHTCYAQCGRRDTPLKDILECQSCDGLVANCMQLVPSVTLGPCRSIQRVAEERGQFLQFAYNAWRAEFAPPSYCIDWYTRPIRCLSSVLCEHTELGHCCLVARFSVLSSFPPSRCGNPCSMRVSEGRRPSGRSGIMRCSRATSTHLALICLPATARSFRHT
jgi:hypothetical protein